MRYVFVILCLLFGPVTSANAQAQVSVGIQYSIPGVSIGINVGDYPQLVRVPDYPVYYAPNVGFNLFFYDGLYWAYHGDYWYASHWYNGPWGRADHYAVPYFILRVPVRYYRAPPPYFRGWSHNAPPRWGQHWGPQWEQRHRGWDKWDSRAAPRPAPLPTYQRQYSGNRYPRAEQQHELHNKNYRFQPRETVKRESYKQHGAKGKPQTTQQQRPPQTTQQQERGAPQEKGGGNKGTSAPTRHRHARTRNKGLARSRRARGHSRNTIRKARALRTTQGSSRTKITITTAARGKQKDRITAEAAEEKGRITTGSA